MHPSTKWYQDLSNLYLTITEPDLQDIKHEFQEQKLLFSASKKNEDKYEMTLNFALPINVEKSAIKLNGNQINIIVNKLEPQWWTYLVTEKKLNFIHVDWEHWKDEFDSDDDLHDYKLPDNFEQMMSNMQNEMQNQ
ncbi:MAG: hypothetical protein HOJ35_03575 [Bdellovibrionales bacterium]|nr:hypothetical protein [Bdellovibrionales bacterium]